MQRVPKMSAPIWAMLGAWTVFCGFIVLHSVAILGHWQQRANGFQRGNAGLAHELTLTQQQLRQTRMELAETRTQLAQTQCKLIEAQVQTEQHHALTPNKAVTSQPQRKNFR